MIPLVGVIMGSSSDWETIRHCAQTLELLAIPYEARVVSAHRTPDLLFEYVAGAEGRGLEVIIAGAGGAAHLPGMAAAKTLLPVLGVPVQSKALNGLDSLLSIVQMPAGVPVGTLAIGRAGAVNAALLAAAVLSGKHPRLREALAGLPLGFRFVFYDPAPNPCAAPLGEHVQGEFTDRLKLELFARSVDVVTFEFENIPLDCIEFLSARTVVRPGPEALAAARDRLHEKRLFGELGIPAPVVRDVDSLAGLTKAVREIGLPAVLKTRTLGYDGKGQYVLRALEDVAKAWQLLGGFSLVLESQVKFDREVSILAVRGANGETAFYPLSENVHQGGILRFSRSCPNDPGQDRAEELVGKLLRRLDYVGVLALELFQVGEEFLANEMAPRVHNSGHWTIEGAVTSQFENHLRAISGLPLGKTSVTGHSAMVNFIGGKPDLARLLALRGLHVHLYGKSERPGRKVGHATLWSRNKMSFAEGCKALRSML